MCYHFLKPELDYYIVGVVSDSSNSFEHCNSLRHFPLIFFYVPSVSTLSMKCLMKVLLANYLLKAIKGSC